MDYKPNEITKDHVLKAVDHIEKNNLPLIPSIRWDVVINNKAYPPKEIMRYAHEQMNGNRDWTFGGGEPTNRFLKKMGFEILEKKSDPVLSLVARYKQIVEDDHNAGEVYKWTLVKKFALVWNGQGTFEEKFNKVDFSNMVFYTAENVAKHVINKFPHEAEDLFTVLYDENKDLQERINKFTAGFRDLYNRVGYEEKATHQDDRTIATYLTFRYPGKYTYFKDSFYGKFCNLLGIKKENPGRKYVHYLNLINDFKQTYIDNDPELIALKNEFLTSDCYPDPDNMLLAQDVLYRTLDKDKITGPNYWRVGTSSGKTGKSYWPDMVDGSYVSIGWSEIGDLNSLESVEKNEIIGLLNEEGYYTDGPANVVSRKAGEILDFYQSIQVGDIVLASEGNHVLGIGKVTSDYEYLPDKEFSHIRPVQWIIKDSNLSQSEGVRTTVFKIQSSDTIRKINDLLASIKETESEPNIPRNNKEFPLNQILFGPPGTGKTYNSINFALEILGYKLTGKSREDIKAIYQAEVEKDHIVFTTFHQSMSYEDFIEGIKPLKPNSETSQVQYDIVDGIFKRLCLRASEKSGSNNFDEAYDKFMNDVIEAGGIELQTIAQKRRFSVKINSVGSTVAIPHTEMKTEMTITRNIMREYVINGIIKDWKPYTTAIGEFIKSNYNINITLHDNSKQNYVIIIDEINRGNVSQIFGELITLIENDKRTGKEEALEAVLPYSKRAFSVPGNLYIIGTMNTADRSVEALDTALRRRFSFYEMPPKPELIPVAGKASEINGIKLQDLLEVINNRIEKLLNKDHLIGHSFFLKVSTVEQLRSVFHENITPLLQEYFYGDLGRIGLVLGKGFVEKAQEHNTNNPFANFDYESNDIQDRIVWRLKNIGEMEIGEFTGALSLLMENTTALLQAIKDVKEQNAKAHVTE